MTTAMRAAIMLAVLVGLPAAWVYYGPLPPPAQRAVDRVVAVAKEAVGWEKFVAGTQPLTPAHAPPATAIWRGPMAGGAAAASAPRPASDPQGQLAARVEPLVSQLRAWGAAAYQLEAWGSDGRLFRFSCDMPLGGGLAATQQFEAVAADPQGAIARVVAEVQSWRSPQLTAMR